MCHRGWSQLSAIREQPTTDVEFGDDAINTADPEHIRVHAIVTFRGYEDMVIC